MHVRPEHRARLLELVALLPGASTRALAARSQLAESSAAYHLERLAREGVVLSHVVGRDRCWYRAGAGHCAVLRRALPVLRRPGVAAVAHALDATPATSTQLAERAGVSVGAARWALQALDPTLLLERSASGRATLREGAQLCLAAAARDGSCRLWGTCAMSRAWHERLEAAVTSSR